MTDVLSYTLHKTPKFHLIFWCGDFLETHSARSSYRRDSLKKGVLKNFSEFTGKHLCQSPDFLIKLQATGTDVFL